MNGAVMNVVIVPVQKEPSLRHNAADLPPLRYFIEIYEPECKPGSRCERAASFEASTPFMNLAVGDVLNPNFWPDTRSSTLLRVVRVEHILWQHDPSSPAHKVCIWTEAVPE